MIESLNTPLLISLFVLSSISIWILGINITRIVDVIDKRFNLGEAFGGLILLAIVTNLAEIAIVIGASLTHNIQIAIGNIFGGIAIQTLVLAILDGIGLRYHGVLSAKPNSLKTVLMGLLVILVLLVTIMGAQFKNSIMLFRLTLADLSIFFAWVIGLWLIKKAHAHLPWEKHNQKDEVKPNITTLKKTKSIYVILIFLFLAIATLIAGVTLEESSSAIAQKMGWNSMIFGATILAAITALPEVVTGLEAIKLKNYTLAIGDIFGGNAFLPVLFLLATLISGIETLTKMHSSDIYLACLGAILTVVYLYGFIFSSKRQYFALGIDSILVLVIYFVGIGGLFLVH